MTVMLYALAIGSAFTSLVAMGSDAAALSGSVYSPFLVLNGASIRTSFVSQFMISAFSHKKCTSHPLSTNLLTDARASVK